NEGHELALVVGRATASNDAMIRPDLFDRRLERVLVPKLERIDWLYVVMAVKQDMRTLAIMMCDHHRMAVGLPHAGVEADAAQILGQPFGSAAYIILEGGIGGDGRNLKQAEQ